MGFSFELGYIPLSFNEIMDLIREGVNTQFGTTYTSETFEGSGFYKYSYALALKIQANEVRTSEIFLKLQDYFRQTNETILKPKTTPEGMVSAMKAATSIKEDGYTASTKKMIEVDAGKKHVCVDVDDADENYEDMKAEICDLIRQYTVGGIVTVGSESETITENNGQSFDWKFNLPDRQRPLLRLNLTLSRNNQSVISSPEATKLKLLENINTKYRLGKDFEPETYFSIADAPWASDILLQYRLDDRASGTITISNYANLVSAGNDEITIGETVFVASSSAVARGDATFRAATSNDVTAESLAEQINAHAEARELVRATVAGAVVTLTAKEANVAGNSIVLTYSDEGTATVGASVSGSGTLAGGAEGSWTSDVFEAAYNDLFEVLLDNIELIET